MQMKDLYLDEFKYEQTLPNKTKIKKVCPVHAIHFVVSGYGYFNGQRLGRGEGFVFLRDELVDYYPDEHDPWAYYFLHISGESVRTTPCLNRPTLYFQFDVNDLFERTVDLILSSNDRFKHDPAFSAACMRLLLSVSMQEPKSTPQYTYPLRYVTETKRYIENHYDKGITIEEIAASLGISRAYLRNVFFEEEGISPQDFLMQVRLKRAKDLLARHDISISESAFSVGYRDVSQFSRMFKKAVGLSPSEYREQQSLQDYCQ